MNGIDYRFFQVLSEECRKRGEVETAEILDRYLAQYQFYKPPSTDLKV